MLADGGNRGVGVAAEERKWAVAKEKREKTRGSGWSLGKKRYFEREQLVRTAGACWFRGEIKP